MEKDILRKFVRETINEKYEQIENGLPSSEQITGNAPEQVRENKEEFNTRAMWYYHDATSTAHHYLLEIKNRVSTTLGIPEELKEDLLGLIREYQNERKNLTTLFIG